MLKRVRNSLYKMTSALNSESGTPADGTGKYTPELSDAPNLLVQA